MQAAELDWQIDMLMDDPTSEIMAQRQFYRSMFVIADVWALTNELDDLCAFLGVLYVQLQQTVGFHRSRRNNDENYGIYDNHLQKHHIYRCYIIMTHIRCFNYKQNMDLYEIIVQ